MSYKGLKKRADLANWLQALSMHISNRTPQTISYRLTGGHDDQLASSFLIKSKAAPPVETHGLKPGGQFVLSACLISLFGSDGIGPGGGRAVIPAQP